MKIEAELKSGYRLTFLTSWDYDEGQTEIGDVIAETIEDLIRLGAKFIDNHCIDLYDEDLKRCMIEECQWIEYKELFGESKFMSDGAYGNYINKEEIFKKIIASSKYLKEKKEAAEIYRKQCEEQQKIIRRREYERMKKEFGE